MNIIDITNENFDSAVRTADKPFIIDFWAPWCVYCRKLSPVLDRVASAMSDKINVGKVNIDEQPELASKFEVNFVPTLCIFKNGEVASATISPQSQTALEDWINANI